MFYYKDNNMEEKQVSRISAMRRENLYSRQYRQCGGTSVFVNYESGFLLNADMSGFLVRLKPISSLNAGMPSRWTYLAICLIDVGGTARASVN
jgi:hypothetical protein